MKKIISAFLFACFLLAGSNCFSQIFLFIEGVKGESIAKTHLNETEIQSFSWGLSNPTAISSATGGTSTGKVSFKDLNLTKARGLLSNQLQVAACTGKSFPKVEIRFYKDGVDPMLEASRYLTIFLEQVFVKEMQLSADGTEKPNESITLALGKMKTEERFVNPDGTINKIIRGWDMIQNVSF